jgi:uncharacterized membrane protein YeaQ/YmgE (transglycosylase-associated protein family)
MVIIDLMTSLMGVRMGFLAFLLIGGVSGASAWIFYPGRTKGLRPLGFLMPAFLGFIAAAASSYLGQYTSFFQSGQMLEWASAILASCLTGIFYAALVK